MSFRFPATVMENQSQIQNKQRRNKTTDNPAMMDVVQLTGQSWFDNALLDVGTDEHGTSAEVLGADPTTVRFAPAVVCQVFIDVVIVVVDVDDVRVSTATENRLVRSLIKYSPTQLSNLHQCMCDRRTVVRGLPQSIKLSIHLHYTKRNLFQNNWKITESERKPNTIKDAHF